MRYYTNDDIFGYNPQTGKPIYWYDPEKDYAERRKKQSWAYLPLFIISCGVL